MKKNKTKRCSEEKKIWGKKTLNGESNIKTSIEEIALSEDLVKFLYLCEWLSIIILLSSR